MTRLIQFSTFWVASLVCLLETPITALCQDTGESPVAVKVKETKLLFEDANQLEKAKTELCVSLLLRVQENDLNSNDKEDCIRVLSNLRYEPAINITISRISLQKGDRFTRTRDRTTRTEFSYNMIRGTDANKGLDWNFPAVQALLNHGPAAVPHLIKAYLAHKKELAEKPKDGSEVVLRNIEYTLCCPNNSENALLFLKNAIEASRLKEILGIEVEAMVELRARINEETKRRR
jgi:hypothetical protein